MLTFVNLRGSSRQRKSGKYAVFLLISVFRRCSWIRLRADSVSGTKRRSTCAWTRRVVKPQQSCSVVFLKLKLRTSFLNTAKSRAREGLPEESCSDVNADSR